MIAQSIHLVRVLTDDRTHHLWAAATDRDDAVDRVLDAIPEGWAASLLDEPWSTDNALNLIAGEVRDITQMPESARHISIGGNSHHELAGAK